MSLDAFLLAAKPYFAAWAFVFAVLTAFEIANPRERHSLRARAAGIAFWAISISFSLLLTMGFAALWRRLGIVPLFAHPPFETILGHPVAAAVAAGILAAVIHDFFFYWYHRAQHRWFWRWHSVHHSVRNLNAVNSYHHISEGLFSLVLIQLPMTLLLADTGPALPFLNMLLWCHIVWIHSPTRLTLGPLRAVLVDNRFHRIHHSLEERHFDKNFGAFTTLWDRVFGTCHMPARDEWPAVGLADTPEPRSVTDWFQIPFRHRPDEAATPVDEPYPDPARTSAQTA